MGPAEYLSPVSCARSLLKWSTSSTRCFGFVAKIKVFEPMLRMRCRCGDRCRLHEPHSQLPSLVVTARASARLVELHKFEARARVRKGLTVAVGIVTSASASVQDMPHRRLQ
ncbi:hypothetical protein CBI38_36205 (plasmid) [Rhodococcus oxybenzonivorans]|uniref:Uncharacterized protein n=1 Tax=Rhodococcus oxybenzonivorans TaxID=1990687 RepID=A0A2S2C7R7_9NOCA|nr:hypothetical protein CBI38_36205 [Rhodococcus oxybenzonivorans]